tara:strand:+ start:1653 stop:2681 length:1029 start_codon:yes stop_codon:yes gene_type:complete
MSFFVGMERGLAQRDQNRIMQKKLDLEEQDRKDAKNAKVMDFLNRVGAGYKNSNDSKNTSKKKAEVLLRLKNSFGEDSEIYTSLLAGGSLENLLDAEKIVNEARERVEKTGATFTVQDAKESFDIFLTEVIKNENQITAEQLAERFGVDPDAELPGTGMSFEEAFQNYVDDLNQDTYLFGMRGKTPITEYDPRDLLSFNDLYKENASRAIDAEVARLTEEKRQEEIAEGKTPSGLPPDSITEYNKAKEAIKDNDFSLFNSLIPNVAADLASSTIVQYPALKNNRVAMEMYSSSLNFSADDTGMYALKRAYDSGLLRKGDIILQGGEAKRITQETIDIMNGLP